MDNHDPFSQPPGQPYAAPFGQAVPGGVQAARPVQPVRPVQPIQPGQPLQPVQPGQPVQALPGMPTPVQPGVPFGVPTAAPAAYPTAYPAASPFGAPGVAQPVRPVQPLAPGQVVQPARPVGPVQPLAPGQIAQPARPVAPVQPLAPGQIAQPVRPVAPVQPVVPGQPVRPVQPVLPGQPMQPGSMGPDLMGSGGLPSGTLGGLGAPVETELVPPPKVREKTDQEKEDELDVTDQAVKRAPPWLLSVVMHILVLIALMLWVLPRPQEPEQLSVTLSPEWSEIEGQQLEDERFTEWVENPTDNTFSNSTSEPVVNPLSAPAEAVSVLGAGNTAVSDVKAPAIGNNLKGRGDGFKQALLGKYGGNPAGEKAVQLALGWLAKQQNPTTGAWSLRGPYLNGGNYDNAASATAMALLAFQGNGQTHLKGAYQPNIKKGWEFLLSVQERNAGASEGLFYMDDGGHTHQLYTHGQALIAVCELYAMTRDNKFRAPAEKAIAYAVKAQGPLGGWRYQPGADSDTSVTGWMVMGLSSARMGGLAVPEQTLDNIRNYLDKCSSDGGAQYGYQAGTGPSNVMTAEGLLCRQYLGWTQNDPRVLRGADFLLAEHMPNSGKKDVYYWYYATQMLHHLEGERWERWNNVMRDQLIRSQQASGPDAGSWSPVEMDWPDHGGRMYTTCMSTFMLEVYYRHLPLYSGISFGN